MARRAVGLSRLRVSDQWTRSRQAKVTPSLAVARRGQPLLSLAVCAEAGPASSCGGAQMSTLTLPAAARKEVGPVSPVTTPAEVGPSSPVANQALVALDRSSLRPPNRAWRCWIKPQCRGWIEPQCRWIEGGGQHRSYRSTRGGRPLLSGVVRGQVGNWRRRSTLMDGRRHPSPWGPSSSLICPNSGASSSIIPTASSVAGGARRGEENWRRQAGERTGSVETRSASLMWVCVESMCLDAHETRRLD
jgi:hypothetical protein